MKICALIAAAALLTLTGCASKEASEKPLLVASVPQIAEVLEQVAGSGFEVVTVIDGNADVETYEPSPAVMRKVSAAEALFSTGTLPFEAAIDREVPAQAHRLRLVDEVEVIRGTHGHELEEDPHLWASLANLSALAAAIPPLLAEIVPDSAEAYQARAAALQAEMAALAAQADSLLAAAGRPAFGIWHPSLSYFARDYGLEQIAVGAEHRELTPRQMAQAVEHLREHGVKVLFYDNPAKASAVQAIAAEAGAEAVLMPGYEAPYYPALLRIAEQLSTNTLNAQP